MRALAGGLLLVGLLSGCFGGDGSPTSTTSAPMGPTGAPSARTFGDSRLFAQATDLFYLEGGTVDGDRVFAGTALGALGDPAPIANFMQPSRVYVWNRTTGALLDTILFEGEDTSRSHAAVGMTVDDQRRLYVLSSQLGLLRFTKASTGWTQENILMFPDLPMCIVSAPPCSPTQRDEPALPNDLTWGPDGNLYVSDSFQATIWKVTPARELSIWFQSADIDRKFGPNGLRVAPDRTKMVLAVTGPDAAAVGPIDRLSKVFSIAFPDPTARSLETVFSFPTGDFADGLAYGARGDLFVLSNIPNRLFIFPAEGGAPRIVTNSDLHGDGVMDVPASLAFDGTGALFIVNYAFADGPANSAGRSVLDVWVDDVGLPRYPSPGIM